MSFIKIKLVSRVELLSPMSILEFAAAVDLQ
jgi:hypothetical protein